MSRHRVFAEQDTTIWDKSITANSGLTPVLQVGSIFNSVDNIKQNSRILMQFNLSSITAAIASTRDLPDPRTDATVSCYLNIFNCLHGDEQATNFTLNVHPLTQSWVEGTGLSFQDSLTQTGYANMVSADATNAWTTSGGTYVVDANSASQTFSQGEENLRINITSIFNTWLNSATANYGLILKLTDTLEVKTGSNSAISTYYKRFYGRETNTRKKPFLQLEWDGAIKDERNFVQFSNTANLFFYNIVNGQLKDLSTTANLPGVVTVSGLSAANSSFSAIATNLSAARFSKGIYRCNFTLPLSANVYSQFKDNWYLSASPTANVTNTFSAINSYSGLDEYVTANYSVTLKNLHATYQKGSLQRIRMHIKDHSMTYTSMTGTSSAMNNYTVIDGSYSILEKKSGEVELRDIPLSFDKVGNFCELNSVNLYVGVDYRFTFNLNIRGEIVIVDHPDKFNFKII